MRPAGSQHASSQNNRSYPKRTVLARSALSTATVTEAMIGRDAWDLDTKAGQPENHGDVGSGPVGKSAFGSLRGCV